METFTNIIQWLKASHVTFRHVSHEPTPTSADSCGLEVRNYAWVGKPFF